LLKIYTKTGDNGTTGLSGGKRVLKSNIRIKTYGNIDEINSILGIILTNNPDDDIEQLLKKIQNDLFLLGADLSNPDLNDSGEKVTLEMTEFFESKIDNFEKELSPITNFILPGGTKNASLLHFARTVTRRAETQLIELAEGEEINDACKKYLNRLSDLFFVLARVINKRSDIPDIIWKSKKDTL